MMGWNMMGWGGGMFFGGLLWLLIIAALVVLAIGLVRRSSDQGASTTYGERRSSRDEPLRILQTRYANGEISREEYESVRRDLESHPVAGS